MGKCPRSPPTLVKHALTLQNDFSLSTISWQLTPTNTWREKELGRYPPFPLSKTPTKSRFLRASLIILTTLIICVFLYSNLHDGGRVIIVQGRRLALSKELSSTVGQHTELQNGRVCKISDILPHWVCQLATDIITDTTTDRPRHFTLMFFSRLSKSDSVNIPILIAWGL